MAVFNIAEEKFFRSFNAAMKFYIVEYSLKEDTTSIRTFEAVLRDNYKKIRNGVSKDYLPVGVFKSREEAEACSFHFQTVVAPQALLESGSRNWKQIGDCFENELDRLLGDAARYEDPMVDRGK